MIFFLMRMVSTKCTEQPDVSLSSLSDVKINEYKVKDFLNIDIDDQSEARKNTRNEPLYKLT
jgi:hypothetical protein